MDFYEILIQKEFEVDILIPEQDLFVYGDRESIDRILYNLVSNVIRYGSDGKYIGFLIREDSGYIYIDITDKRSRK